MKIISKIEIKYFRSFSDKVVKVEYLKDLNIISGGNDSGKSNILRALNLFFNNEISHGVPFDFERDFSKIRFELENKKYQKKKEVDSDSIFRKSRAFVEIKCFFDLTEKPYGTILPKKFWISKKWNKFKSGEINSNIDTEYKRIHKKELYDLNLRIKAGEVSKTEYSNKFNYLTAQRTRFLEKIDYFYVPAIKDYNFFKELYSILQKKLTENSSKKIKKAQDDLQNIIKSETEKFFEKFKISTNLDANFLMENKLLDFGKNIEVETIGNILLTSRGDGVQARLIPDILDELTDEKRYVIWGFEEPENSYEYRHSKKLADEFYNKFSEKNQIFLTTHAKEFLGITDVNGLGKVSIYRVFKGKNNGSKVEHYDEKDGFSKEKIKNAFSDGKDLDASDDKSLQKIYDDLGIIDEARVISRLESEIKDLKLEQGESEELIVKLEEEIENFKKEKIKNEELIKTNSELEAEIIKLKEQNKIIIFCENQNANIFNSLGFKGVNFIFGKDKQHVFESGKNIVDNIFSIIDKDLLTDEEIDYIEKNTNVISLRYYCFENYLWHPDNLEEYFQKNQEDFDKEKYKNDIINEFKLDFNVTSVDKIRSSYKYISEGNFIQDIMKDYKRKKKEFQSLYNPSFFEKIKQSEDFEEIYKFFSMKDCCKKLNVRISISKGQEPIDEKLSKTNWFKRQIKDLLLKKIKNQDL